jgi:hypothetical protein
MMEHYEGLKVLPIGYRENGVIELWVGVAFQTSLLAGCEVGLEVVEVVVEHCTADVRMPSCPFQLPKPSLPPGLVDTGSKNL